MAEDGDNAQISKKKKVNAKVTKVMEGRNWWRMMGQ